MTPKKKKIYIAVIIVCFAASGFLLYNSFAPSSPAQRPIVTTPDTTAATGAPAAGSPAASPSAVQGQGGTVTYHAPAVFPADTKFDWSIVASSKFQGLSQTPKLTLDPSQIGREDPLKPY